MNPYLECSGRLVAIGLLALSVVLAIAVILLVCDAIPFLMNGEGFLARHSLSRTLEATWYGLCSLQVALF